ncbi:MAG: type II toxin-antitoxin system mRNA interferase toxin, RelE/StbE family [Bacteroidetes bacterium QH_10_64_37]|nr:MAG: type II toxin-antitoxin system mRNA interferase toxin, RelE/StbE family [Bacteroidetes bacterium QH_10_64_37]
MNYETYILRRAQKALSKIQQQDQERIVEAIWDLENDPRPHGCKKLSGREGWRVRVGQYRVIYEIDDESKEVTVLDIGHRRDVYR